MTARAPLLCLGFLLGCAAADTDFPPSPPEPECQGLACLVAHCPSGQQTVVRGRVTAPNRADPIDQAVSAMASPPGSCSAL